MFAASSIGVDCSSSDLAVPLPADLPLLARLTVHDACLNEVAELGSDTACNAVKF